MSNIDSSSEPNSRALWVIIPLAVGLSLMFTNLKYEQPKPQLKGDLGAPKHELKIDPSNHTDDTTHVESAHADAPAGEHADTTGHAN